jgi:lysozyme
MISNLEDQLRRDEEERQFAYDDATSKTLRPGDTLKGNLTIGIGRNLTAKGLSKSERDFLLANDVRDATADLAAAFPWAMELDQVRKDALLNMVFNEGVEHVKGFRIAMGSMQARNFQDAAAAFLDSLWAKQVGARARRLAEQIVSGTYQ